METPSPIAPVATPELRRDFLQRSINYYMQIGYRVVSQTEFAAQMLRPKQFNFLMASLFFLCFGVGVLFYLFLYMAAQDSTVYIQVDEQGRVSYNGVIPQKPREAAPARSLFTEIGETLQASEAGQNVGRAWAEGGTPERLAIVFGFGVICVVTLMICAFPVLLLTQ